jgi:hypothetical protein
MHGPDGTHDTLGKVCFVDPAGLAVGSDAHDVPFQPPPTVRKLLAHTAVHALAAVHDTPA